MESVLRRLKLIKPNSKEDEARRQLLNELFSYKKGLIYGFPVKPSALAYDSNLAFLAIGTENGTLRIYGRPGVQLIGQHPNASQIEKIIFLDEQARLLTLSRDRSIYKWEMNVTSDGYPTLTSIAFFVPPESEKIEKWVTCLTLNSADLLFAANQIGDVHVLDVESFQLVEDKVIKQEDLLKIATEEQKSRGTSINCIAQHPTQPESFLIGYQEGIMINWNGKEKRAEKCFGTNQHLECSTFNRSGTEIVTSHSDGSHMTWNVEDILKHVENASTPYGPFACKEITKIVSKTTSKDSKHPFLIFSGGMPKSNFGEKSTVTVMRSTKHVVFDLQSRVIDFVVLCEADEKEGGKDLKAPDNPHTLLILTAKELLAVDLASDDWPLLGMTQVTHVHDSPVSCLAHFASISQNVWIKMDFIRRKSAKGHHLKDWTAKGGHVTSVEKDHADLLITGHENGDVVFWQATQAGLKKVFNWCTGDIFENSGKHTEEHHPEVVEDNWPPFRKVTYSVSKYDDPRLAITKIAFCPETGTLIIGGAAGQVLVAGIGDQDNKSLPTDATFVDLMGKGAHYESLTLKKVSEGQEVDFGLLSISSAIQVDGIHPCTDLSLKSDWQLLGIGTSNGFVLFDLLKKKVITSKCTVVAGTRGSVSRSRSFQQSLRESFRNIKKKPASTSKSPEEPPCTPQKGVVGQIEDTTVETVGAVVETVGEVFEEVAKTTEEKLVNGIESGMEKLGLKEEKDEKEPQEKPSEQQQQQQQQQQQPESGENVKVVSQEIKEHKIEQLTPSKKSEVITTITTTNISTTTTTTNKKDAEDEQTSDESKTTVNGAVRDEDAKKEGEEGKESKKADDAQPEPQSRGSTLKREGVTFDVCSTPSKAAISSSSSVTCVRFMNTCLSRSGNTASPTMWVGLSDGKVFAYQLVIPQGTNREQEDISAVLAKEIHLKHGAPVCNLVVIDDKGKQVGTPVAEGTNGQGAEPPTHNHRLVVCSWEQIKTFSLPGLKAQTKHKLFKNKDEGRICAVSVQNFKSKSDDLYSENALVCMTSKGDVVIINLPTLKFQVKIPAIQLAPSDCDLIGQCWFLSNGVATYKSSEDELTSFSLSTVQRALPHFTLPLKEGMRPPVVTEEATAATEGEVMEIQEGESSPVHEPATALVENGDGKKEDETSAGDAGAHKETESTTTTGGGVGGDGEKKPQEIIVDVKKYSTTTTTTTTIQNESSDAAELLEDSVKCHLGEGDDDTVMVMTSHDIIENKMTIKTTLHTLTDPQGSSTETKTVVKETTSTCIESNFQDGNPVGGDGTSVN